MFPFRSRARNAVAMRTLRCSLLMLALGGLWPELVHGIEVRKSGHYLKLYHSQQDHTSEFFDAAGTKRYFDEEGRASFEQQVIEYRFGLTHRWNVGFRLPRVVNSFDNRFGEAQENGVSDFIGVSEYRLLTLPWVLALRGEFGVPLTYRTDSGLWVGNGTYDVVFGLDMKRFLFESCFFRLWVDAGVGYRFVVHERSSVAAEEVNIDGDWSVPYRASVNVRPLRRLILLVGAVGSHNEARDFLAVEGGIKYRGKRRFQIELLRSRVVSGHNSTSASAWLFGISLNTRRLWD